MTPEEVEAVIELVHEGCIGACTMDETESGGDLCECLEFEEPEEPAPPSGAGKE